VLTLFGWEEAEQVAAWAPVILIALLLASNLPIRALRRLHPPLRKGFHAAVFGMAGALIAGLFTQNNAGLAWPWWLVLAVGWLLAKVVNRRPDPGGDLMPGEHRIEVLNRKSREVLREPALRQCIVSAAAADVEIDLSHCGIVQSPVIIDLDVWFSKLVLKVRPTWSVAHVKDEFLHVFREVREQPLLRPNEGMPPDVAVRGVCMFSTITYRY
jgi:hypothetical protein